MNFGTPFTEVIVDTKNDTPVVQNPTLINQVNTVQTQFQNNSEEDTLPIRVTGRKIVKIIYPLTITKADIAIVKEQLKVLELLIDTEKEEAT